VNNNIYYYICIYINILLILVLFFNILNKIENKIVYQANCTKGIYNEFSIRTGKEDYNVFADKKLIMKNSWLMGMLNKLSSLHHAGKALFTKYIYNYIYPNCKVS
jgi:hypothetical protein